MTRGNFDNTLKDGGSMLRAVRLASEQLSPEAKAEIADQRHRAVRKVASTANDATDAALILDVLGLSAAEGRSGKEAMA